MKPTRKIKKLLKPKQISPHICKVNPPLIRGDPLVRTRANFINKLIIYEKF